MHARGHDADMAMLLCAARVLGEEAPDAPVAFAFGPGLNEAGTALTDGTPLVLSEKDRSWGRISEI